MESKPDDKFAVARRFKAMRQKALLSQSYLGSIMGVCRQSICEIENAHVMPHPSTWERFVDLETKHNQPRCVCPYFWR